MERLNLEQLARLVDGPPTPDERAVLDRDPVLRRELDALRSQTEALGDLPAVLPPPGGWHDLEKRLTEEGLIFGRRDNAYIRRKWLQAAAALVIFVGGTALGWVTSSTAPDIADDSEAGSGSPSFASEDEARTAVLDAIRDYRVAYGGLQQWMNAEGRQPRTRDPAAYLAAVETLMAASRAAVEQVPDDRFLNEMYVRLAAEREQSILQAVADWR